MPACCATAAVCVTTTSACVGIGSTVAIISGVGLVLIGLIAVGGAVYYFTRNPKVGEKLIDKIN